ncbi:hypothetical protein DH2020_029712 [Rehmannia glutinosa]|uniref:Major facilitator superfamily (MFS) profile domain-containing protein n=1 Tax=Rehmannia glutinosa TaxID=99300 RepID=A0ABR0VNJ0_REHGL
MAGGPIGPTGVATERAGEYKGRVTAYVIIACLVAAVGGSLFGYDIGISGGVTSMDGFLEKFFPAVYRNKLHAHENNYCKYNNQGLSAFTSSLYLAGLVSSLVASPITRKYGRRGSIICGGISFMIGATLDASAVNLVMLILGRIMLGVGIGFGNQILTGINSILFYAPVLFQTLGFGGHASLYSSALTGAVLALSTFISIATVDRLGRRALLISGGIQMVICQVIVSIILGLKFTSDKELSKTYSILVVVIICLFVTAFGWSWGPLGWTVPSEIFPLETRSAGKSIGIISGKLGKDVYTRHRAVAGAAGSELLASIDRILDIKNMNLVTLCVDYLCYVFDGRHHLSMEIPVATTDHAIERRSFVLHELLATVNLPADVWMGFVTFCISVSHV